MWIHTYQFICTGCNFWFLTHCYSQMCDRIRWFVLKWKFVILVLHYKVWIFQCHVSWRAADAFRFCLFQTCVMITLLNWVLPVYSNYCHIDISYDDSSTFKITVVESSKLRYSRKLHLLSMWVIWVSAEDDTFFSKLVLFNQWLYYRQQITQLLNKFYKAGIFEEIQVSRRGRIRTDFSDSNRLYR